MSGLKLGDLVLDPARAVYIPSLRAVVCSGLFSGLKIGIGQGLRGVIERTDSLVERYKPESFIVVEPLCQEMPLAAVSKRWAKHTKFHLVGPVLNRETSETAEQLGFEVHQDLMWGRYRFVADSSDEAGMDVSAFTITGGKSFEVKLSKRGLKTLRLPVFLRGIGRLSLPSFDPTASSQSVFNRDYERCDVFAVGHHRILPLGKVLDLKRFRSTVRGGNIPLSKSVLSKVDESSILPPEINPTLPNRI